MTHNRKQSIRRVVVFVAGFVALAWTFSLYGPQRTTYGEVREVTPKRAFKSGGARSELVLHEISATLKRIDERLERIENMAATKAESKP